MKSILVTMILASYAVGAEPALDEVNAARAQRGLPPYQEDKALTAAAKACADFRAAYGIAGHSQNDFSFLPAGASADAAGCAMWEPGLGWGACATYESYQFAGAAYTVGANGMRFMHLFVRGGTQATMQMGGGEMYYGRRGRRR